MRFGSNETRTSGAPVAVLVPSADVLSLKQCAAVSMHGRRQQGPRAGEHQVVRVPDVGVVGPVELAVRHGPGGAPEQAGEERQADGQHQDDAASHCLLPLSRPQSSGRYLTADCPKAPMAKPFAGGAQ